MKWFPALEAIQTDWRIVKSNIFSNTITKTNVVVYISFKELLLDFDRFSWNGGKQPLRGDCRNKDDVESCFCLMEMEDKQLNELVVRLRFSLSSSEICPSGSSWLIAVILSDSGSMQLHTEPTSKAELVVQFNHVSSRWRFGNAVNLCFTYLREAVHPFWDLFAGKLVANVVAEMVAVLSNQVIHIPIVTASRVFHELSHLCRV